jgi:hypothetical protein
MKTIAVTPSVSMRRSLLLRALAGALAALAAFAALPQKADAGVFIGVGVSVGVPPPPLPVYEQPPIPGPGYIWTPGYWAWDGDEYYWVPGTWVPAPFYGALWTPGYWGWDGALYVFHPGYWGDHIGFYGGINYGCGYFGRGYDGGYWGHGGFYYNRTVNHIENVNITNVYNKTVINNVNVNHISYNGGRGGVMARATPQQMAFARQARMGPIAAQQQQMNLARQNPAMRVSANHGAPPVAATPRPGVFAGAGVVPAARSGGPIPVAQHMNNVAMHGPQAAQANGGFAPHSANFAPHANNAMMHAPQTAQTNSNVAAHSANFAPHANMPAANMRPMSNAMQPNNNMALRSASFAPHANMPNAAPMQHVNNSAMRTPQSAPFNNGSAFHSANFAHTNAPAAPNAMRPSANYSNLYRPGGVTGVAPTSRPMQPMNAHPMNTYRAPATAYRPAPAPVYRPQPQPQFHAPQYQYHAAPAPQYRASRPAPAPHPSGGGAPHGGGGRDMHHG